MDYRRSKADQSEEINRLRRLVFQLYDWACRAHQLMVTYGYLHVALYLLSMFDSLSAQLMRTSNGCFAVTAALNIGLRAAAITCRERLRRLVRRYFGEED